MPSLASYISNTPDKLTLCKELISAQLIDASNGALFGAATGGNGIAPATKNRTIIIGLGGTGVETVDRIKGAVAKRLDPTWNKYVAFLGIDSDDNYFKKAQNLDPTCEQINITKNAVERRSADTAAFPGAWQSFRSEPIPAASLLAGDGCSRTRLFGRMKVHDQEPGKIGVDEEIVNKIHNLSTEKLSGFAAPGSYEVFVIGSLCGGTCSGSFLEMPYLVREALTPMHQPINIYAMLYLPDTVTGLDPANAQELKANGYASLKELNYFQGITMRTGYSEEKAYNGAVGSLKLGQMDQFYSIPYLVASRDGGTAESIRNVQEEIAEFLISIVGDINMTDSSGNPMPFNSESFKNNSLLRRDKKSRQTANPNLEAIGEAHEFPKHYGAIGFAKAAIPQEVVYSYEIGQICLSAGIKPIGAVAEAGLSPDALRPFRSADDLLSVALGEPEAKTIINSIASILKDVHNCSFTFSRDLGIDGEVEFQDIQKGVYDTREYTEKANNFVKKKTAPGLSAELEKKINEHYRKFEDAVKDYIKENGPFAFVNVFDGKFVSEDGNHGIGLKKMLENLRDGKTPEGKAFSGFTPPAKAKENLDNKRGEISNKHKLIDLKGVKAGLASDWVKRYETWINMRVNQERRELVFDAGHLFDVNFYRKACLLRDRIEGFGYLLCALSDCYSENGDPMSSFEKFQKASDSACEVNIAAVNVNAYNWIQQQAQASLANANAKQFRDSLVDDFFNDPAAWTEIPNGLIEASSSTYHLIAKERPIPAREKFDKVANRQIQTLNVAVNNLFDNLRLNGVPDQTTVDSIVKDLYAKSKIAPTINKDSAFSYIVYPSGLDNSIVMLLKNTAPLYFGGQVLLGASNDASSIMAYQQTDPYEIYSLSQLKNWEADYEHRLMLNNCFMHGFSQAIQKQQDKFGTVSYTEMIPWSDYPPITDHHEDRVKDPSTGMYSREGQILLNLDKEIEEAKRLGVLYCVNEGGRFQVKRVYCDKSRDWKFNPAAIGTANLASLQGKGFAETYAQMNGVTLNDISKPVILEQGGIMSEPQFSEDYAWQYAARVLRYHIPMLIEVRKTVELFKCESEKVQVLIDSLKAKQMPQYFIDLFPGLGVEESDGVWTYKDLSGVPQTLANLSELILQFLPDEDKALIQNGTLYYYLYKEMLQRVPEGVDAVSFFEKLAENAKSNQKNLLSNVQANMQLLQSGKAHKDEALKEKEMIIQKGATTGGTIAPLFKKTMESITDDEKLLKDIQLFYLSFK